VTLPDGQLPDGLCVDTAGCVWLAVWGQSCIFCLTPEGDAAGRVEVPTPLVTSCAFGGPDYRTLFMTTASEDDSDPFAGRLFAADVGAQGAPPAKLRLSR
jgi:sugar lactone lactonase YvrE